MTLRYGREVLAMPGPTNIPDSVLNAMHRPAIDIYSGPLLEVTERCHEGLCSLFGTQGHAFIYAANGHGAWEAALSNTLSAGDEILVLASGRFAINWGATGESMGLVVHTVECDFRDSVSPARVSERLRKDTAHAIKAVLVVQVDTASGVVNDIPAIRAAISAAGHPALFMVDTIASLGTMTFTMDAWGVDVAVCGAQKGLMTPPGLSFCAAGAKALAAHESAGLCTRYWDWTFRRGTEHYHKYCGTPPEHMLFGLDEALRLLQEEGFDKAIRRHTLLARAVRAAVEMWAKGGVLDFNVAEPDARANSVTTIRMAPPHEPGPLLEFCRDTCGVTLGLGIGGLPGFRIAHMGHVNAPMMLGTLGCVELGLKALDIPHGQGGVQAAVETLAEGL